jgi:hypothetical protein
MMMMKNDHTEWTDRLSEYLDGGLSEEDHGAIENHLAECGVCRRVLEDLRSVVTRAGKLGEIQPSRDLWAGIAATIQAPAPVETNDAKVIALPLSSGIAIPDSQRVPSRGGIPSRFSFSTPQLAAAAIVLIATSSLATWVAGPGLGVPVPEQAAAVSPDDFLIAASNPIANDTPPPALAEELADLEAALNEARSLLDPTTIRVLQRNLAVIEEAISDSRRALEQDPGNEFLSEHLERVYERKLTYLRDAARVTEWSS